MAVERNIDWDRGEDIIIEVTVPFNLTGDDLKFVLKHRFQDATVLVTKTTGSGITLISASDDESVYEISVPAADSNQAAGEYRWSTGRTTTGQYAVFTRGKVMIRDNTIF